MTNCTFENNDSTYDGGAIYTETLNEPLIKDCTFKNNKANNGVGGAIRLFHIDSNNVIKNCKFTNNSGRGANVFVQYGHGLGDKLTKEWATPAKVCTLSSSNKKLDRTKGRANKLIHNIKKIPPVLRTGGFL